MRQFVAKNNENDMRLSRFVISVTSNLPQSLLYKSFRNKRIKVNGKKAAAEYRIVAGDVIELYINDEFFPAAEKAKPKKRTFVLKIIYEDDNIAAVYKPAHMLCHSDRTGDANLVDLFTDYLIDKGEYDPNTENTFSPTLCNRIDRGTQGIVLAAKNYAALRDLNTIIRDNLLQKHYLCITIGAPKSGVHTAFLKHGEQNNKVHIVKSEKEGYKNIITGVEVVTQKAKYSLCSVHLITGRTHQIRAHLAFLNTPILGDIKYGDKKINAAVKYKTQALCAFKVIFNDNIDDANSLSYLKNKVIKVENPDILNEFEKL